MAEYWQCPGCYVVDQVPCWSPEACLTCGETYDGSGWSEPDPVEDPVVYEDPEERDAAQDKKDLGEKHSPVAGCPEDCPYEHEFDLELQVDEVPGHGRTFKAYALLTPPLNPADAHGEWFWSLQGDHAELLTLEGGKRSYSTQDALRNWVELRVADAGQGEATLACSFRYTHREEWLVKLVELPVGMSRVDGEKKRSLSSSFRVERFHGYRHPWDTAREQGVSEELLVSAAWLVYDFAIGSADMPPEKLPQGFKELMRRIVPRIGEPVVFKPEGSQLNPTVTWLRKVHIKAYSDALGDAQLNDWLRTSRKDTLLARLMQRFPALDPYIVQRKDLTARERQAIDRVGHYVAGNEDELGRRKNRGVVFYELLEDATEEFNEHVEEHEDEQRDEERRRRLDEFTRDKPSILEEWIASLPSQGREWRETRCIVAKAEVAAKVTELVRARYVELERSWRAVTSDYARGLPEDSRAVYFARRDVDHYVLRARLPGTNTLLPRDEREERGSSDIKDYRQSVVDRAMSALDFASRLGEAKGEAHFHAALRKVRDELAAGVGRVAFFQQGFNDGTGTAGITDANLARMKALIDQGMKNSRSVYSCLE